MKIWLTILLACCTTICVAQTQWLDLKADRIELESGYNSVAYQQGDRTKHFISIIPSEKQILIKEAETGAVVFDIAYQMAFDGTSEAVKLQPGEALFMVRKDSIELVSFQEVYRTLSINFKDGKTLSFGEIDKITSPQ